MIHLIWILPAVLLSLILAFIFYILSDFYKKYTSYKKYKVYLDFIDTDAPGPYQVSLHEKYDLNPPKDEHGAIVYQHYLTGPKPVVHPIRNTHVALAYYERYINEGDQEDFIRFKNVLDTFIKYKVELDNGSVIWYYPPYKYYENQKVPWTSAMSQGQMLAVLARAYYHTNDDSYRILGEAVLKSFETKIEDGGVVYEDNFGLFYEEFSYWEKEKRNHTLNGMLSALFGIFDFHKVTGNEKAKIILDRGVATIKKNLILYDQIYCSSYDLRHLIDPINNFVLLQGRYNAVHVGHLRILHKITGDDYFLAFAELWDIKLKDSVNRLRLTGWYLRYKLFNIKAEARRFGWFNVLWSNYLRFKKKKPLI